MESEFEPTVRKKETHDGHIVDIDLPGFRREDVKVQINNRGSLVISGERGAKEITKVGGKSEKVQRGGNRFRKFIEVPQNLNFDSVSAKFSDARLRVSLPLLHVSQQQNADTLPGSGKADQSLQSNVDRSSPAGQQDSRKERDAPAQDDKSARHQEAIQQGDDKENPTVAAEKSNELLGEKKAKALEQAKELVGEPPISSHAQAGKEICRTEFPASCRSTFSNHGVLVASTVLVLSIGLYITYKSRSRHHI